MTEHNTEDNKVIKDKLHLVLKGFLRLYFLIFAVYTSQETNLKMFGNKSFDNKVCNEI
jgi:hypothetical protein